MKPVYTMVMVALLIALGAYVFLFEREPISPETAETIAKINIVSIATDQVTGIQVDLNAPAGSVALIKKEQNWQFADGKAADKERIERILQQLSPWQAEVKLEESLAPERLSEFGLEPPQLLVRISLASGDKVLKIGKKTPTSSGYYAKIEGDAALYLSYVNVPEDLQKLLSDPPVQAQPVSASENLANPIQADSNPAKTTAGQ